MKSNEERVVLSAPAKVNLFLEIMGHGVSGYHEIATVMQTVDLVDTLEITRSEEQGFGLEVEGVEGLETPDNLVLRAARQAAQIADAKGGARFKLTKAIPVGAGLGGGSSDAAAALMGLNRLWGLRLPASELALIGARVGSDVPFFFSGDAAVCTGRGEKVEPIEPLRLQILLVVPAAHVSTARVYENARHEGARRSIDDFVRLMKEKDVGRIAASLFNRLEQTTRSLEPEVARLLDLIAAEDVLGWRLSGSGGAVYAIVASKNEAVKLARKYSNFGYKAWAVTSPSPSSGTLQGG